MSNQTKMSDGLKRSTATNRHRKQSPEDRELRLSKGCCPVHGLPMPQVGNCEVDGEHFYLVECPRLSCSIQGLTAEPDGPIALTQQFSHLLEPEPHLT